MLQDAPSLTKLLKTLQQVPYLASKNLYRVTNYFLHMDDQKIDQFCAALKDAKANITQCSTCFVWREREETARSVSMRAVINHLFVWWKPGRNF